MNEVKFETAKQRLEAGIALVRLAIEKGKYVSMSVHEDGAVFVCVQKDEDHYPSEYFGGWFPEFDQERFNKMYNLITGEDGQEQEQESAAE